MKKNHKHSYSIVIILQSHHCHLCSCEVILWVKYHSMIHLGNWKNSQIYLGDFQTNPKKQKYINMHADTGKHGEIKLKSRLLFFFFNTWEYKVSDFKTIFCLA